MKTVDRIAAIDATRGLVMVIMALDHVRDLLHLPALTQNPTDLATTTPALFLTRWITHLCAPTFVFLSGTSAYFSLQKQNTAQNRRFLRKRGFVLLLLELTVINFAFWFDIHFQSLMLQVIYAIGGGLVLLSLLTNWSLKWVGLTGLVIVLGHNLLQGVPPFTNLAARLGWSLLFRTEFFALGPHFGLLVAYPLIPWLGIMLVGYASGPVWQRPMSQRRVVLARCGLGMLGAFVVLRLLNHYGDPAPWTDQKNALYTLLSFINLTKYPPSLLYDLLMLGIMLVFTAGIDGTDTKLTRWLMVYGKVPLFYYILHWYLVHSAMLIMNRWQGYSLADSPSGPLNFGRPPGAGISLVGVYGVWLGIVLLLYPICQWYGHYKRNHPEVSWLRYI